MKLNILKKVMLATCLNSYAVNYKQGAASAVASAIIVAATGFAVDYFSSKKLVNFKKEYAVIALVAFVILAFLVYYIVKYFNTSTADVLKAAENAEKAAKKAVEEAEKAVTDLEKKLDDAADDKKEAAQKALDAAQKTVTDLEEKLDDAAKKVADAKKAHDEAEAKNAKAAK